VLFAGPCEELLSVCNPSYAPDTVRIAGTALPGLTGTQTLARFTLNASQIPDEIDLTLTVLEFLDASTQPLPVTTVNGRVSIVSP